MHRVDSEASGGSAHPFAGNGPAPTGRTEGWLTPQGASKRVPHRAPPKKEEFTACLQEPWKLDSKASNLTREPN